MAKKYLLFWKSYSHFTMWYCERREAKLNKVYYKARKKHGDPKVAAQITQKYKDNPSIYHIVMKWLFFSAVDHRIANDTIVRDLEFRDEFPGWNIYVGDMSKPEGKESYIQHARKMEFVHHKLKNKLLRPAIRFLGKRVKNYYKGVPPYEYNRVLQAFDNAFESSITDWNLHYLRNASSGARFNGFNIDTDDREDAVGSEGVKKYWADQANKGSSSDYRTMKELSLLFALNDSAHREFLNIFMFKSYMEMHKMFKNDQQLEHLFVDFSNSYNLHYVVFHRCMKRGQKLSLYMSDEIPCCDYATMKKKKELQEPPPNYWGFDLIDPLPDAIESDPERVTGFNMIPVDAREEINDHVKKK